LYQEKNSWQKLRACCREPKRSGNSGRYFKVLKWLSEKGLSSETCGRLWVFGDAQIGEQKGHGLGGHGGTPVGVEGELAGDDLVLGTGFGDELAGQFLALPMRHHPADDIPAEDVEDYIEVEVGPLGGAQQLGDVPTPELIGSGGQQLRFLVGRMDELVAAFAALPFRRQEAV
jgi:hypothetical protein